MFLIWPSLNDHWDVIVLYGIVVLLLQRILSTSIPNPGPVGTFFACLDYELLIDTVLVKFSRRLASSTLFIYAVAEVNKKYLISVVIIIFQIF